jgi:hypothetical protein
MILVKPVDTTPSVLSELVRDYIYPTIPFIGVACVWAHAYAAGLESKLITLRPHEDQFFLRESAHEAAFLEKLQAEHPGAVITSTKDGDDD